MSVPPENENSPYLRRIARGAGINSFGQVVGRLLNYATQIALARMYGPAQLGFYVLGLTLIRVADIFAQFGMNSGAVRYIAQYRTEGDTGRMRGVVWASLLIALILSSVLATIMFFGGGFLADRVFDEPFMKTVFRVFSISLPFLTVMSIALWITQGFQTMKYTVYVQEIQRPALNLVLVVVFYLLGVQVIGAVAAYVLSTVVGTALAFLYLKRLFPKLLDRNIPTKYETRALLGASAPMVVANSTLRVNDWAMVTVVGIFATADAVGIFNAAVRTAAISGLVLAVFRTFTPMVSDLYSRGRLEQLNELYKDVSRWTFTGSLIMFLVTALLAKDILMVFGPQFVSGWVVLLILSGAQLFNASMGHTGRTLAMTGHQKVVMLATVGATVAGVAAGIALIPTYGILGAGVALATGNVLMNIVTLFSVKRLLGLWPYSRECLKPLIAGGLAFAGVYLLKLMLSLPAGVLSVLILAPLLVAVFTALLLVLGLNFSDRQLLTSLWVAVRYTVPVGR